jgi:lysine biosynthesis protein LysW
MAHKNAGSLEAKCPTCGEMIRRQAVPKLGQRLRCDECDDELEVVRVDPFEVEWVFDDWDDDEPDEDDDWD